MGREIERKFLLKNDDWRHEAVKCLHIKQGYIGKVDLCSVRVRIHDNQAFINLKSAQLGISRTEFEYAVPIDEGEYMLRHFCQKPIIEKYRHIVHHQRHTWEIDEFLAENHGLVVAEVELEAEDESFQKPVWLGREVSHEKKYYNVCLIEHPYEKW